MDVTCDRCHTRYEFDEALVSSRGTTVKCTQCGHQFRVHRPAGRAGLTRWTVRTTDGREIHYDAMRNLQAAIGARDITPDDLLVANDGSEPRRLGRIEELKSFFARRPDPPEPDTTRQGRRSAMHSGTDASPHLDREGQAVPTRTGDTLPPPLSSAGSAKHSRPDEGRPAHAPEQQNEHLRGPGGMLHNDIGTTSPGVGPAAGTTATRGAPHLRPATRLGFPRSEIDDEVSNALERVSAVIGTSVPPTDLARADTVLQSQRPAGAEQVAAFDRRAAMPPGFPAAPDEPPEISSIPPLSPSPSMARPSILRRSAHTDPRFSDYGRRSGKPGFARWIVGILLLGLVVVGAISLLNKLGKDSPNTSTSDADNSKVAKLVQEGDRLLLDGDIDGAKELYAKASGAAEHDPRALRALARVAIVQADRAWLRTKIDGRDSGELERLIERASQAAAAAAKVAPDDAQTAAMQVDVLRLQGKLNEARKLVTKMNASEPNSARALATLDLCEAEPSWDSAFDRLRSAALAEKKLGQAQAMLVFALARRGDPEAAQRELDRLAELSSSFPLLDPLREMVAKTKPAVDLDAASTSTAAAAEATPSDYREALRQAHVAKKRANYDEAERLFHAALDKNPGNSEALAGLAEVAKARGNSGAAEKRYQDMLKDNPDFVPGLIGLADMKWQGGDRAGAIQLYRQVVVNAPGTSYADHATARINEGPGTAPAPTPSATADPIAPPPPADVPPPAPPPPAIDTSDLPP